jgi:uncharacterized Zn-binding protein involved in type VI secretion
MSNKIARGSGTDSVNTGHGCDTTTVTAACSGNVKANGIGIVRFGDAVQSHLYPAPFCVPHAPTMDTLCASKVFVNGKKAAYLGSKYGGTHDVSSGSSNVYVGA